MMQLLIFELRVEPSYMLQYYIYDVEFGKCLKVRIH